jgi:penicillin-binding protein 2
MSGTRPAFHPYQLALRGTVARRVLAAVFLLLGLAFFRLQVLEHDEYRLKSETNRLRPLQVPAPRGLILDRHGAVIAENVPGYSVSAVSGSEDSLRAMLLRLAPILPLDSDAVGRVVARYHSAPYEPTLIVKDAPFPLVSRLEELRPLLPGLLIQTEPKREYPESSAVAHLVGYLGEADEEDLAGADSGRRLGAIVGKQGLEREYESSLAGADGVRFVEVDAMGRVVKEEGAAQSLPPVPGQPLHTTIDLGLQRYVASIFPPGRRGAVVAMDPGTGGILALYSSPAYDPNAFVGGVSEAYWKSLNSDPGLPLLDRTISARYPPGSTFKLAVTLMALRRGLVNFDSYMPLPCRGGIQYGRRWFRCWDPNGHGYLTLEQAIENSCDVYFYQLGLKLGVAAMLEDGDSLGFGDSTDVDLPGELHSSWPGSTAYYDRLYGRGGWTNAVAMNLAIGQGEDAQTLINMVRFYAALANGGHVPHPHLLAGSPPPGTSIPLPDSVFAGIRHALLMVVEQGTARGIRLATLHLAGKTGTAQNSQGPDHGWFIGFAPAEQPRIVVGAVIEASGHGGTLAAPLVAQAIERYLLAPDTTRGRARIEAMPFRAPADTVGGSRIATPLRSRAGR